MKIDHGNGMGGPAGTSEVNAANRDALRRLDEMQREPQPKRYRHKKRGTTYTIVGHAKLQIAPEALEKWLGLHLSRIAARQLERFSFVVYRCERDGALWVRRESEFFDGRFEEVAQ